MDTGHAGDPTPPHPAGLEAPELEPAVPGTDGTPEAPAVTVMYEVIAGAHEEAPPGRE